MGVMAFLRFLVLVQLSFFLGCGGDLRGEADLLSVDTAGRFIQIEPDEMIQEAMYARDQTTITLPNDSWQGVGSTVVAENGAEGVVFSGPKGAWVLEADVGFKASGTPWLLFEFNNRPKGNILVEWSGPGQTFAKERSISLGRADGIRFKSPAFKFSVGSHPLWKGNINSIRLQCQGTPDSPMTLVRSSGGVRVIKTGAEQILKSVWKIELGRDVRNGFVALPEKTHILQAEIGDFDRFHVSVGIEKTAVEPVSFSVLVDAGSGTPVAMAEETLDPGKGEGDQWVDLSVDLGDYQGKVVHFLLSSSTKEWTQLEQGLAWWAGPRLESSTRVQDRPNIVIFCIDTLRADRMSVYGHPVRTTPELDHWIRKSGVVFETVIASAPWTLPSHVSMFSGISALRHGVNHAVSDTPGLAVWERPLAFPMIAEVLRGYGYHTAAFTGGAFLHPRWGLARGFDTYVYWSDRARSADELETNIDEFTKWAENQTAPWFAFVHTYEVHDPYLPRPGFFKAVAGGVARPRGQVVALEAVQDTSEDGFRSHMRWVVKGKDRVTRPLDAKELDEVLPALYDSHVAYADEQIGGLLNRWIDEGLSPNTIVAVTSDHGQVFGETQDAGHIALHETTIGVPLLLALPGGQGAGWRIGGQARLIDLFPTLLDGAGLQVPSSIDGVSLMPAILSGGEVKPRFVTSVAARANAGVSLRASDGMKLVVNDTAWRGAQPRYEVFDVAVDPSEKRPLPVDSNGVPELVQRLTEIIRSEAPGLVMTVCAEETADLEIDLGGLMVQQRGLKTIPQNPADLIWRGRNRATLQVPAGKKTEIRFEKIFGELLSIKGRSGRRVSRLGSEHTLSVVSVRDEGPVFFSMERGCLVERDPETRTASSPGLYFTWRGPSDAGIRTRQLDPELSEQLKALGYVE